jgi:hypothetical protein
MKVYLIKKYREIQYMQTKDGKIKPFFVTDVDDLLLAIEIYCKDFLRIFSKETPISWDKEKEVVTFYYYECWDDKNEYLEEDFLDVQEIAWIRNEI